MNKSQARDFAKRLIQDLMEAHYGSSKEPLCYYWYFGPEYEGCRLSDEDEDKVCRAMQKILDGLAPDRGSMRDALKGKTLKPSGVPGKRWSKYGEWRKKCGYDIGYKPKKKR